MAKDGVAKLLGPTAEYLGEGVRDLTQRRVESIGKMFSNASKKLGGRLEQSGEVPPTVLRTVLNEASYREDQLSVEYVGGVLASSRTEHGRDDRGSRMIQVVDGLTSYQMRTHYLIYSSLSRLFSGLVFCPPAEHCELMSGLAIPFSMWQCAGHGDAAGPGFVR